MRPLIGFDPDKDYLLDPQQRRPAGWCPECGREIWSDGQDKCNICAAMGLETEPDWGHLRFFDKGHIYMVGDQRVPSVSDLCRFLQAEVYGKDVQTWKLEAAALKGTAVHKATEDLDKTGRAEIDEDFAPYLTAYAAFLRDHEVRWEKIEEPGYNDELGYAGTIDRYGSVDGSPTLLDIKTTYKVERVLCHASLNLYRMMLERKGVQVERMLILHLNRDGTYKLVPFESDDTVPMALITLHRHTAKKRRTRRKTNE